MQMVLARGTCKCGICRVDVARYVRAGSSVIDSSVYHKTRLLWNLLVSFENCLTDDPVPVLAGMHVSGGTSIEFVLCGTFQFRQWINICDSRVAQELEGL